MNKLKLISTAVLGGVVLVGATNTNAAAVASAQIGYTNFQLIDLATGDSLELGTDITLGSFNEVLTESVNFGADADQTNNEVNDIANLPFGVDAACAGDGADCAAVGEDSFSMLTGADLGTADFSYADGEVTGGTGLDGTQAASDQIAKSSTTGPIQADANSELTNSSQFTITPDRDIRIGLLLDPTRETFAAFDSETDNEFASANATFSLSLLDGNQTAIPFLGLDLGDSIEAGYNSANQNQLGILNVGASTVNDASETSSWSLASAVPDLTTIGGDDSDTMIFRTGVLGANEEYTFTIDSTATTDLVVVPVPGTVALMGLGLLGLASIRRRRALA